MKLRLPHKFQTALMAALASVSITTLSSGSATAAELNKVITMGEMVTAETLHGATASTTWVASDGSAVYDFSGSNCIFGIDNAALQEALTSATTTSTTYVTVAAWINPTSHGGCIFGYGDENNGIKVMDASGALKFTTKGKKDFDASGSGIDTDQNTWQLVAVTFSKNSSNSNLDVYYMVNDQYSVTPAGDAGVIAAANPATFGIGTGNSTGSRENFVGSIGGLTVFTSDGLVTAEQVISQMGSIGHTAGDNLAWNGTVGHNVWNTENTNWVQSGAETSYTAGSSPFFGVSAEAKDVVLGTDITAGAMTVEGAYTFNTDGGNLTATSLKLGGTGTTFSLEGGSAGHKSTIGNIESEVGSAVSLANAQVTIAGNQQGFKSSLSIGQGATVTVSVNDSMKWSDYTNTITLLEGGELAFGSKRWSVGSGTTIVMAGGTITGTGDGTNGALDYHQNGATIRTIANSTIGASIRLRTSGQITNFDVAPETTLTLSGILRGAGTLNKTGVGTINVASSIDNNYTGNITVAEGTLLISGGTGDKYHNITVNEGATVDLNGKDTVDYRMRHTLAGGTLTNTGANTSINKVQNDQITLTRDSYVTGTKNFYMLGYSYGATYLNLNGNTLHKTGSNTVSLISTRVNAGVLDIHEGTIDFNTEKGDKLAQVAADIILDGGTLTGKAKYIGDATLQAKQTQSTGVTVVLNGARLTPDVLDAQTLTMTGAITGTGTLGKTGAGTAILNNSGNNIALSRTIVVDGGTLNYTGSLSVASGSAGNFEVFGEAVAADFDGEGEYAGSGFRTGNATKYYLMKVAEGATVTGMDTITGATRVTEGTPANSWVGTIDVGSGDSTYYVNKALDYNNTVMGSATGMAIAKDATLTSAGISAVTSAKVLHGAGTYVAPSGFSNNFTAGYRYGLGANVSLAPDWTGTVVISGNSTGGTLVDFARLANGKLSTVEVKGLTGWTNDWNGEIEENIILTDVGTTLAWSNGAASKDVGHVANFSGKWSGSGTFARIGTNYMDYKFSGDISEWTGKFKMSSGNTTNLTFTGDAHEVNAAIERSGGTLNVVADTNVDFKAALTSITDFTVNAGNTVTFASAPGITNLKGAGTIVLDPNKIQSLGSNRSNWTGTVVLTGTKTSLNFGNLTNGSQSTLELKGYTGYSDHWNGTNVQNIKLTNPDGGVAWDATGAASTGSGQNAIYSGTWSGDGTMLIAPNNLNYTFSGDISQWTGKLENRGSRGDTRAFNLTFTGNANLIKAEIIGINTSPTSAQANTMNLVVNTDATFSKQVTADTLTVNPGWSATLQGDGTFGSLAGTGALVVQGGGSNTVTVNGASSHSGSVTVVGGTLALTSSATSLASAVSVNAGGTLKLSASGDTAATFGGLTLASGSTVDLTSLGLDGEDTTPVVLAHSSSIDPTGLAGVTVNLGGTPVRQGKLGVQGADLMLTYQNLDLIWDNNAGGNVWNTTSKNWHTAGHDDVHIAFMSGDNVTFNESATVSLAGATEAGRMTLAEGTTLNVTANANALTMQGITLGNGSSLVVKSTIDSRSTAALQVGLGDVSVSGTGSIDTLSSGWNVEYTITDIDGAAGSILQLGESNQVIPATVYNLTGNRDDDFKGKLKVSHNISPSAARRIAVNIQGGAETLLQFSEVELSPYNNGNSNVGLGVNTNASVMGISSEVETAGHAVIFSGQASAQGTSDFASGSTAHTLTINTAGRDFTSGAKILAQINLLKDGEGTQRFTGDLSAMNGTVGVKAGTLALTNTGASAGTLASATVDGGALQLGRMNVSGAVAVNGGSLAFSDAASAASVSVAEGGSLMLGSGLTTTGNMTVGNGATLGLNASAPLTIGGNLELGNNITYNIGGVRHAGEYTVASAGGTLTFGTSGNVVNLNSSIYSGTLSQQDNNLVLNVTQTGKVLHMLLLTGQSNSLGAVKGEPASDAMLAEYAPHTTKMWDGNMSGSIADPSVDTKNKAWNDTNKHWFTVQRQYAPTGKDVAGPADTPYEHLTGQGDLRNAWGGATVMGPEYGFSYMMEKQGWNIQENLNDIAIVKVSRDGGENTFWDPANSNSICPQMLDTLIKAIKDVDAEQYPNISLDGLMFLQGETGSAAQGNNVRNVLTSMITYLQDGLAEAMQEGGELEGYAGKLTVSIGDSIILGEPAGPSRASTKPSAQVYKQWAGEVPNQVGFVYTQDLGLYTDNLHYDGNSQITIGARYAYTMAQVQGLDTTRDGEVRVRSQAYGDAMLEESPVSLNDDAAWWKSSGDKTAYSAESLASTVAVWDVSSAHMANGERITGNLALGGIRIEDPYSDGQNPGDHQATITINCDSTGYALSIGQHGIELQQGDLTIGANVNATATQSWNTVYTPEGGSARTNHLAVTGTVTIEEGVLLTFNEGSHIRFNSIVGAGSLTIGNGVTLAMSQADVDLKGGEYTENENGFRTDDTVLIHLTGANSAITATLDQLHFEDALADQEIKLSDDGKSLLLDTTTSMTFHVRDSEVEYSDAHPEILQAKSIGIHDMGGTGATLVLKQNLPGGDDPVTIVASGTGGTVVIDSGVSLNASAVDAASSALTIAGSGKYVGHAIGAVRDFTTADVLGQGVSLAEDWSGNVVVSGGNPAYADPYTILDPLADIASSLVLNGVYGYFSKDMSVSNDIEFRGTEEGGTGTALTYTAGNKKTLTLNGKISGSGDFFYNKAGSTLETIVMNGDIAEWTGTLRLGKQAGGALSLTLGTGVTEANFNITRDSGSNRGLTLTVNDTQAVDFTGTIGGTAAITKAGTGTLTLNTANSHTGGTTVSAGTLVADNAGALGTGSVSVTGGNLVINAVMNDHTANSFNNTGGTLTMNDGSKLTMFVSGGIKTYNLGAMVVNGSAGITTKLNPNCYNAEFNISSLTNGENAVLELATGSQTTKATVYNLNTNQTSAYDGKIVVKQYQTGGTNRPVALNVTLGEDAREVALSKTVISFADSGSGNKVGLGLGADATVKGIESDGSSTGTHWIFSGAATTGTNNSFASGNDVYTLTIDTDGTNHSTSAKVMKNVNLVKTGEGTQALSVDTATANQQFNGSIDVEAGVLNIMNAASVSPADVTIGANGTLGVYTNGTATEANEGTLTIANTKTLTAAGAGATLNANVVMAEGSNLDVSGTGGMGLLMGSDVTLNPGNKLTVNGSADVDSYLRDYFDGSTTKLYTLYSGTERDPLQLYIGNQKIENDITFESWDKPFMDASTIYTNLQAQTYYLVYDHTSSNVGMVAIGFAPEPTTGTLSLLALAALAARRRRK